MVARSLTLLVGSLLLTAGCLGDGSDANGNAGRNDGPPPPLPAPIEASEEVVGGLDPFNAVEGAPCTQEASGCTNYPFTLLTPAMFNAELSWTLDANDFDLYLYRGDEQVALSAGQPPAVSESISGELAPGEYELVVVAWFVTSDTYTLTATFAYP